MAIVFSLASPVVIAAAGYGVETVYWHYEKLKIQEMADVAAHAAAIEKRAGSSYVYSSAQAAAADNGFTAVTDTLTVNGPPTSGEFTGGNAVEAFVRRRLPRFFSRLFTSEPMMVRARSVSVYGTAGNACVLALDPTAARAADFADSSTVELLGCNVMANSTAADSVYVAGAARLRTPCIMTAGGVQLNSGATLTTCAAPMTALPPVADPFKDVPEPTPTGPCQNGNAQSLGPGRYCGGLTLKNNVSLAPGIYHIDGGALRVNSSANVTGSGVTFHFLNGGTFDFNGNATMTLTAPTSGDYSGMLMFGGRENGAAGEVKINGTASSEMTGAIYFPKQHLVYQGNFSGSNGCTQVVAKSVQWTGNTTVSVDCTAAGMPPISVGGVVKLAE